MSSKYDEIIKQLFSNRIDLMFNPSDLDTLDEAERFYVEGKLVELCQRGNNTSYKYMPYIKDVEFDLDELTKDLPNYDKAEIFYDMYEKDHDEYYLDSICELATDDYQVFSLLTILYMDMPENDPQKEILLDQIIDIKSNVDGENKEIYNTIYDKRIGISKDVKSSTKIRESDPQFGLADDFGSEEEKRKIIENIIKYSNSISSSKKIASIKDSLYGFIVGDAFGVPYEFTNRNSLKESNNFDMVGYGAHFQPEGSWSDDTSMTLATIDSISNCKSVNYEDIMNSFCDWFSNSKYTSNNRVFDVGITTRRALEKYAKEGFDPVECGCDNIKDNGNGSLMRIMPVCFYLKNNDFDEEQEVEIINNVSSLTHAHEISQLGCFIYYQFIKALLDGKNKEEAYNEICNYDYSKYYSEESIKYYSRLLNHNFKNENVDNIKSGGFVVDTLEAVIWTILNTNNYKDSIIEAVNLGRDTDTVGAITGSISGIIYGYQDIPKEWLDKIPKKDYLNGLIDSFDNNMSLNNSNDIKKK